MTTQTIIKSIIIGVAGIIGGLSLYYLLDLPEQLEWYQLYGLFLLILVPTFAYLLILIIVGLITRFLGKGISRPIFNGLKWSVLILILTIGVGMYSGQKDLTKTRKQNAIQYELKLKQDSINYVKKSDSLDRIIEFDSANYEAFVERGLMKRRKGNYRESIFDYEKALDINPEDFKANLEMGYSYRLLGNKELQDSFYRKAARIDTNSYFAKKHPEYLE